MNEMRQPLFALTNKEELGIVLKREEYLAETKGGEDD